TNDVAEVNAFDKELNKLNVSINPSEVDLKVAVEPYSKKVKVRTKSTGKLDNDRELDNIKLNDKEVEIYGSRDDLQSINEVTAEVDLDGVSESTEKTVKFDLPDNVTKVSPKETKAYINVK
ncbi:CdaR family protein, partial [Staphylococcus sp.]